MPRTALDLPRNAEGARLLLRGFRRLAGSFRKPPTGPDKGVSTHAGLESIDSALSRRTPTNPAHAGDNHH
jgi:hypothetical protein